MQLSRLESDAHEKLKENGIFVFGIKELCMLLSVDKTKAYNIVKALKKKKVIKNIGKGKLALMHADELAVAPILNWPSYISFWSALNYYGFSDQMPKKIYSATTKYSRDIGNFKYVTLNKKRFFGYTKIGEIVIADKEKAFIDSLLFPKYSGGIKEIEKSLKNSLKDLDIGKLVEYALRIESKAVIRRLGFILESLGYKEKKLERLRKKIGKGYELLDPNLKKKNNLNKKWLLDVNK